MDTRKLEKLSPNDIDSEMATLGALMISGKARADVFSILEANDFYRLSHIEIFKALQSMYLSGEKIDAIILAEYLKRIGKLDKVGGKAYIHSLVSSISAPSMCLSYTEKVKAYSDLRKIDKAVYDIHIRILEGRKEDVDEFKRWAFEKIRKATLEDKKSKIVKLGSFTDEFFKDLDKRTKSDSHIVGIPTGFAKLDIFLSGLQRAKLYTIAARTSIGKSSFALNILLNVLKEGYRCLLFSLEEGWMDIYRKLVSIGYEIDSQKLVNGRVSYFKKELKSGAKEIDNFNLYYYDSMAISISDIKKYVKECKYKYGLDLVVVDYIQLVESSGGANREQKVASVARGLKTIAAENDLVVIGLLHIIVKSDTEYCFSGH